MRIRNVESRLIKLEAQRQRADQFLAVWRKPAGDIPGALADAKFFLGDRVVCLEWFGDDPIPAPRWHRNVRADFTHEEESYIKRALQQIVDASPPVAVEDLPWVGEMTEGELLNHLWGVAL